MTRVDDEKYPPFKLRVPEVVDGGKLSGMEATTAGRVGWTAKAAGWLVSPFCRSTVIANELGAGPAKKVEGMVARRVFAPMNVVATGAPLTRIWLVEKKWLPNK